MSLCSLLMHSVEGLVQLIDFIISTHPAHQELKGIAKDQNKNVHDGW